MLLPLYSDDYGLHLVHPGDTQASGKPMNEVGNGRLVWIVTQLRDQHGIDQVFDPGTPTVLPTQLQAAQWLLSKRRITIFPRDTWRAPIQPMWPFSSVVMGATPDAPSTLSTVWLPGAALSLLTFGALAYMLRQPSHS